MDWKDYGLFFDWIVDVTPLFSFFTTKVPTRGQPCDNHAPPSVTLRCKLLGRKFRKGIGPPSRRQDGRPKLSCLIVNCFLDIFNAQILCFHNWVFVIIGSSSHLLRKLQEITCATIFTRWSHYSCKSFTFRRICSSMTATILVATLAVCCCCVISKQLIV